jgi:hypothetical protein
LKITFTRDGGYIELADGFTHGAAWSATGRFLAAAHWGTTYTTLWDLWSTAAIPMILADLVSGK